MALFSGAAVSLVSHGLRYAFSGGATEVCTNPKNPQNITLDHVNADQIILPIGSDR